MPHKKLVIIAAAALAVLAGALFLKQSPAGTAFIWKLSAGGTLLFPLVSVSALLDSLNPCAFSILLLTIAFLFSLGTLRAGILKIGLVYVLGIFAAYLLIGLGILQALHLFNTPHFMGKLGAVLLVLLGLVNLINEFWPRFLVKLGFKTQPFQIPQAAHNKIADLMQKTSLPAAFLLGGLVGLCEFPCTGGPYLMVLGLLHDRVTYFKGLGFLIWYNLLFVAPLVIVLLLASDQAVLTKAQAWRRNNLREVRLIGGFLMIVLGIIIFYV